MPPISEIEFLTLLARDLGELQQDVLQRIILLQNQIPALGFKFTQGRLENMITGAAPGGSCRIVETPVPAGGQLQAGSALSWSTTDPNVGLAPSADGTSVVCTIAPANTNTSFPLHLDGTSSNGNAISGDVSVPIIQTPPPVPATGFSFDQAPV